MLVSFSAVEFDMRASYLDMSTRAAERRGICSQLLLAAHATAQVRKQCCRQHVQHA